MLRWGMLLFWLVIPLALVQAQTEPAPGSSPGITFAFDYGGELYMTDFSEAPINLTNSDTYEIMPVWSPDGAELAFLSSESYRQVEGFYLHVMTLATGEIHQLSDLALSSEAHIAWSPDSQRIAATLRGLFIVDAKTGEASQLAVDSAYAQHPTWSPDGSRLVFHSSGVIYVIDADGRNLRRLTDPRHQIPVYRDWRPAWSPASNDVLVVSNVEEMPGLYIINVDSATITPVVELSGYEVIPHIWSPDGQRIAFGVSASYRSDVEVAGGGDVYIINRDGSEMRLLSADASDSLMGWSPDSQHVIYWAGIPGGAGGSFYAVNITDGTQTLLSGAALDRMCSYNNCPHISIRP